MQFTKKEILTLKARWKKFLKLLKIELLPYQEELVNELFQFPFTAKVTQCRQSGKSFVLGLIIYFVIYVLKWDVIIVAPKLDQTWAIMKNVHKAHNKMKRTRTNYDNRYSLSIKGRGSVQCLSGSETANVEGPSAHLVVIDEHQEIQASHAAEIFLPMVSWYEGLYWTSGIGGVPGTLAEREDVDLDWELVWQDVVKVKPGYQRTVDRARKEMFPEEFAAHFECKKVDISGKLLIPNIMHYSAENWGHAVTTVGIDWGKRLDRTVATVVDKVINENKEKSYFITSWKVVTGSYDEQMDELVSWLKNDITYDYVIAETNGVGDGCADFLIKAMKDPKGFDSGVTGIQIDREWKTDKAKEINKTAMSGDLKYNKEDENAVPFIKDVTKVQYKMLDSKHIKVDHSDFISSLMCAMDEPGVAYV